MAVINTRNVPDELYHAVRLAAAGGGTRIPRGALEQFVVRALRRAVELPVPGAGLPRVKLCASCFTKNQAAYTAPRAVTAPPSNFHVGPAVVVTPAEKAAPRPVFAHLLREDATPSDQSAAIAGMMGVSTDLTTESQRHREPPNENLASAALAASEHPAAADADSTQAASAGWVDAPEAPGGAVEVFPGLWVGSDAEFSALDRTLDIAGGGETLGWSVLSAAKEPWHRRMVGYRTRSAPEGPERLFARRGNHLALNLIDVRELGPGGHDYVPEEVIAKALEFIGERLAAGDQVLVHCNCGQSRAPGIALLYLLAKGELPSEAPLVAFRELYARFLPSAGMDRYIKSKLSAFSIQHSA